MSDSGSGTPAPLQVSIVSDVVCPWCFVGKRRFERAVALAGVPVAVSWRPYQLDPTLPPEGKDRRAYMAQKFGSLERVEQAHARLTADGKAEGIAFDFDAITISPNTLDAHRLIRWAAAEGFADATVEALFSAYFEQGRNVGNRDVLAEIAAAAGMDGAAVRVRLDTDEDRDAVSREVAEAQRLGVTGVPTFIVAGKYAMVGAQPPADIARALATIAEREAGAAVVA